VLENTDAASLIAEIDPHASLSTSIAVSSIFSLVPWRQMEGNSGEVSTRPRVHGVVAQRDVGPRGHRASSDAVDTRITTRSRHEWRGRDTTPADDLAIDGRNP
jgi:hypothetical protein